jgi:hypothetical protein
VVGIGLDLPVQQLRVVNVAWSDALKTRHARRVLLQEPITEVDHDAGTKTCPRFKRSAQAWGKHAITSACEINENPSAKGRLLDLHDAQILAFAEN